VAADVVLVEVAALVLYSASIVVEALRGDRSSVSNVVLLVVMLLAWAAALGACWWGLREGRRWSRSPIVLSQVMLVLLGIPLAQNSTTWWAGLALVALAVVGLVSVLRRSVTEVLYGPSGR
jgi:hypothetical protein